MAVAGTITPFPASSKHYSPEQLLKSSCGSPSVLNHCRNEQPMVCSRALGDTAVVGPRQL